MELIQLHPPVTTSDTDHGQYAIVLTQEELQCLRDFHGASVTDEVIKRWEAQYPHISEAQRIKNKKILGVFSQLINKVTVKWF